MGRQNPWDWCEDRRVTSGAGVLGGSRYNVRKSEQVLYYLIHPPSPFSFSYFSDRVLSGAGLGL
jgi:hypothetical protein